MMVWRSKIYRQTRQLPESIHAKTCLLLQKESFFLKRNRIDLSCPIPVKSSSKMLQLSAASYN